MELALTATSSGRADPEGEEAEGGVIVTQHNRDSASCRWTIQQVSKVKQRTLWSKYFQVGGYDWRLLVYPGGDSQALPGYVSLYLQVRATPRMHQRSNHRPNASVKACRAHLITPCSRACW